MASPNRKLTSPSSSADISAALERARADLVAAEAAVLESNKAYENGLLELDKAALRKLLDATAEAKIDVDQRRALIRKLERELESASANEAEAARVAAYSKAKDMSDAAWKKLELEYPKAAQSIRDVLRALAEAELAVRAANEDLPAGAAILPGPESERSTGNLYREELGEEIVDLWCDRTGTPIDETLQQQVRAEGRIRKHERYQFGHVTTASGGTLEVQRRRMVRRRFHPQQNGRFVASLASELSLPPLMAGASPYWSAETGSAAYVLHQLDKPIDYPAAVTDRPIEVEYLLAPDEGNLNE